jgi:outer membrane beta-barrel protein
VRSKLLLVLGLGIFLATTVQAQEAVTPATTPALSDFDSLGGNSDLLEKAKAIQGSSRVEIIQNRIVQRSKRWELSPEYTQTLGGDSYVRTEGFSLNAHYHLNPRWSVGGKYTYHTNSLTKEGKNLINDSSAGGTGIIPAVDYAKQSSQFLVNWYPVYGKVAFLDQGVTQFDMYASLGGGQIETLSGRKSTYSAGAGVGFWWNSKWTTRFEVRYQNFQAKDYQESKLMNWTVAGLQMGYLL